MLPANVGSVKDLISQNKVETAVDGCNLAFSLDSIVSLPRYAFYVVYQPCIIVY